MKGGVQWNKFGMVKGMHQRNENSKLGLIKSSLD